MIQQAAGTAVPSIVSRLLQTEDLSTADLDREEFIKNCGGVVYSGMLSCLTTIDGVLIVSHSRRRYGEFYSFDFDVLI